MTEMFCSQNWLTGCAGFESKRTHSPNRSESPPPHVGYSSPRPISLVQVIGRHKQN